MLLVSTEYYVRRIHSQCDVEAIRKIASVEDDFLQTGMHSASVDAIDLHEVLRACSLPTGLLVLLKAQIGSPLHGPHRKHSLQQFLYCSVGVFVAAETCYRLFPSNGRISWLRNSGFERACHNSETQLHEGGTQFCYVTRN
jgi:hypothetical protein